MSTYSHVASHGSMAFDDGRNRAYREAMREVVDGGTTVLDLGAGVGVHGLQAARLGARKVYLVDPSPVVHVAAAIARASGLADRVECRSTAIERVELPEKVDVLVSVFTGNFLLEEDLLELLFLARDRHLIPGGAMIPDRARMWAVPVSAEAYFEENVGRWSEPRDELDLSAGRRFASNQLYYDGAERRAATWLSEPQELLTLDLRTASDAACRSRVDATIEKAGTIHGLLGWFDMRLGREWFSTSPAAPPTHWRQAFLPIDPPLAVEPGQRVSFEVRRPPHGEWTWSLQGGGEKRRHSTFLATPAAASAFAAVAGSARPTANELGLAAGEILAAFDGTATIDQIAERVLADHPDAFLSPEQAGRFVRRLARNFS